jgi:hypothetical protein
MFNIQVAEFENELGRNKAKEALEILTESYPGYSWKVDVKGGICFVRLLDLRLKGTWGMNMKLRDSDHDSAVFKQSVKFGAGEFLERCKLRRGRNNGDAITRVDGLPERWQP